MDIIDVCYNVFLTVFKILRGDVDRHMKSYMPEHVDLIMWFTLNLSNEMDNLKESNKQLTVEMQQLKETSCLKICELEEKLEKQTKEFVAIRNKLDEVENEGIQRSQNFSLELNVTAKKLSGVEETVAANQRAYTEDKSLFTNNIKSLWWVVSDEVPGALTSKNCGNLIRS